MIYKSSFHIFDFVDISSNVYTSLVDSFVMPSTKPPNGNIILHHRQEHHRSICCVHPKGVEADAGTTHPRSVAPGALRLVVKHGLALGLRWTWKPPILQRSGNAANMYIEHLKKSTKKKVMSYDTSLTKRFLGKSTTSRPQWGTNSFNFEMSPLGRKPLYVGYDLLWLCGSSWNDSKNGTCWYFEISNPMDMAIENQWY